MEETRIRSIITTQLDDVAEQLATFQSEVAPTGLEDRDVGDDVDTSQRLQAQSENSALLAGLERERAKLENALTRLDAGDYGTCEVCGAPIEDERLEMRPWTRRDAKHAPDPDTGGQID